MSNAWPTRRIDFSYGNDWYAEVTDLSVGDVQDFEGVVGTSDIEGIARILLRAVYTWNLVDREGNPLPVDATSIRTLPTTIMRELIDGVITTVNQPAIPLAQTSTRSSDIIQQ